MANSARGNTQSASEDASSLHQSESVEIIDATTATVLDMVETTSIVDAQQQQQQLQAIVDAQQQEQRDNNNSTMTAAGKTPAVNLLPNNVVDDSAQLTQHGTVSPPQTVDDVVVDGELSSSILRPNLTVSNYRAKVQAEIREELVHPDAVFITEQQYKLDRDCAVAATRAHTEGIISFHSPPKLSEIPWVWPSIAAPSPTTAWSTELSPPNSSPGPRPPSPTPSTPLSLTRCLFKTYKINSSF